MANDLHEGGHVVREVLGWGWWTGLWALCWVILLHLFR